ncbi:hypothetical protein OAS39_08285, partial [Pirellulales bacterium]|nr:hypothetical protein [Pirellulales bacterium]
LREKAGIINYRVPKNYVDHVVEACVASGKEPNELGQVGMMLLVSHRFFDFHNRLHEVETQLTEMNSALKRLFWHATGDDNAEGHDD